MSAPTYDAYRDSGIDWLGNVPSHWKIDRLKASVASSKGGIWGEEADGGEEDIVCIRVADFRRRDFSISMDDPTVRKIAAKDRNGRLVSRGNLLLEKSGGGEKQPVGAVSLYDHDVPAVCSNFVTRLELAAGMHPSFWRYVHAAAYDRGLTFRSLNQTSGIQNLDQARYLDERAAYPSPAEQAAIAAFLDRETGKIDALVEAQTRLIELLKEKRQAVISHAVTKGLDPAVPMKDSGVEWLGRVPAHWTLARLKNMTPAITVGIVVEPSKYYVEDGVPALRSLNVKPGRLEMDNLVFISERANDLLSKSKLRAGDLVAVRTGQPGTTAIVPPELDGANCIDLIVIRKPYGSERFLCWYLASDPAVRQFSEGSGGAIQQHFNIGMAVNLLVPHAPLSEQEAIADFLDVQTANIDALVEEALEAMVLLKERRAALISAAVTGKIDVRGLAPEQAEAA